MQVPMPPTDTNQPEKELNLTELLELLIRHFGVHKGLFDLSVQIRIGTGAIGLKPDEVLPGAIVGFAGVGLKPVKKSGPNTLDAAQVNPEPPKGAPQKRPTATNRKRKAKRKHK
jgi:hypothetical protein